MFNPFKKLAKAFSSRKSHATTAWEKPDARVIWEKPQAQSTGASSTQVPPARGRSNAVSLTSTEAVRQASANKFTPTRTELAQSKRNLKTPEQHQQRYILSPHNDVRNLFNNSVGMGAYAKEKNRPAVRPVFKDDNQRASFNKYTSANIKAAFGKALSENGQNRLDTMKQLQNWSTKDNAMMDLSKTKNSRGQHPVVYVQGHGQAGDKNIYSDAHEKVGAASVADMLDKMQLPKVAEVRANSCFSGTEVNVGETQKRSAIKKGVRERTADVSMAGNWSNTFAGTLEKNLHSTDNNPSRHNRVVGYIGPTGQGAYGDIRKVGQFGTEQRHQKGMFATSGRGGKHELFYKRSDMKRTPGIRSKNG